ncbi:hypothetical protein [Sphingomonas sp.]|jgi:FixJ family two-component response regulator|uniref:hypothetical protein n=1 Tax=Sphingomonas sp. TaxID=28214 RepID=UPI003BA99088
MDQRTTIPPATDADEPALAIALVDPDDGSRRALHMVLSGQRHRVRSYDSTRALAEDAKAVEADWLVLSVRTDGCSLEAVERLRARGWCGRLAVIAEPGALPVRDGAMIRASDLIFAHPVAPHAWRIGLTA